MSNNLFFSRRFWVKDPRHSETIFAKKRYTSIVARVINNTPIQYRKVPRTGGASRKKTMFHGAPFTVVLLVCVPNSLLTQRLYILRRLTALLGPFDGRTDGQPSRKELRTLKMI